MGPKILIYLGLFIGSTAGSYIPTIWGASFLSLWSIIAGGIGGLVGIWLGFKLNQYLVG